VVGNGCAASLAECDDTESNVRECGDGPRRTFDRYGRGPMQDHEGMCVV